MIRSRTNPRREIATPSVLRQGTAHLEPFNGSHDMLSIGRSEDELAAAGPHQAVLTARVATNSVRSTTIEIPPFAEWQPSKQALSPCAQTPTRSEQ